MRSRTRRRLYRLEYIALALVLAALGYALYWAFGASSVHHGPKKVHDGPIQLGGD